MSHNIDEFRFAKGTSIKKMQNEIAYTIENNLDNEYGDFDPEDNPHDWLAGLTANDLKLYNKYFESESEAKKFLPFDFGAWGAKVWKEPKESSEIKRLNDQVRREKEKLGKYIEDQHVSNRKSQFIGCPKCQSKVNKDYISDPDRCPVCHTLLLSNTVQDTIKRYKSNIVRWEKQAKESGSKQKHDWYWYVVTDYHT